MKTSWIKTASLLLLVVPLGASAATLYVDSNSPTPTAPYSSWTTAATNIQDAIEAAGVGDLVLVTNGVYATGGKVMAGDLTNRVALDKAITVQSVNGPWATSIRGVGASNGLAAVRCAWITNGATLQGFTLTAGATRSSSGDPSNLTNLLCGGGALCLNTNALLQNCLIISNVSQTSGGGVFQGVVLNSAIIGNRNLSGGGSGAAYTTLINSTVVSNWSSAATFQSRHSNSIVYYNSSGNYVSGTFAYSCTTPAAAGLGNIITAPQLLPDAIHLLSTSPCRAAGTNLTTGFDIDGQIWANPPSIGCDEWRELPLIVAQPRLQLTNSPTGFSISVTAAGLEPFTCYWTRNGLPIENDGHFSSAHSTNLVATGVSELDAGAYQVVVSNAFGTATSSSTNMIFRFVNAANVTPLAPYSSWSKAAINIQDAIDAAVAGEVVLVTNGFYRSGGKVMSGDLTNRVALNKAIVVQSVNGPGGTVIEGNWNPTVTNGSTAVRCVWMTNGAALSGFTICGGATRLYPAGGIEVDGGGIWGSSTNTSVVNCFINTNTSAINGGGAYRVSLLNCRLQGNRAGPEISVSGGFAGQGGAAASSNLRNCIVQRNYADRDRGGGVSSCNLVNCALLENSSYFDGGAAYSCKLWNCTVTRNTSSGYSSGYGAAVHSSTLTNCVIWGNFSRTAYPNTNYASSTLAYCLSSPLSAGIGNLAVDPQLISDGVHVAETSPCRAAGANIAVGADIDGQVWANPPSIGCDEWNPFPVITFPPTYQVGVSRSLSFEAAVAGQTPAYYWFRNSGLLQDDAHQTNSHTVNLKVLKFGPEHAGNYSVVVSNSFGMATSQVAQVVIHCVDAAGSNPISSYSTWATAATSIQAAIDVANAGDILLVTNGVYATGGKVVSGDLLNRVAIDKPLTVLSMNGRAYTFIDGAWDVTSMNGPAAVRAVWMTNGAVLGGFTARNGATRGGNSLSYELQAGGGVYAVSTAAIIANCWLTNNTARWYGGGAFNGTLRNCVLVGNIVDGLFGGGGGAAVALVQNCTITGNAAKQGNFTSGAGTYGCQVRNSIVVDNYYFFNNLLSPDGLANYYLNSPQGGLGSFLYSCTFPLPPGAGNITVTPYFIDASYHLPLMSPCRGSGSSLYASGEDIDGEAWANPPSMGADEVIDVNLVGPISLSINGWSTNTYAGPYRFLSFYDSITGRVSRIDWDFGDGLVLTNVGSTAFHSWTNPGTYTITSTAYNNDYPTGVSASLGIQISPLISPQLNSLFFDPSGFKFSFVAQESARYTIQYATNLTPPIVWKTLQDIFSSPGGITQITDPAWTNAARFYRVWAQ